MSNKVTYEYAIIRLMPRVELDEFFNIGVIIFSKRRKYLDMKYHISEEKHRAFNIEHDISTLNKYLEAWKHVCYGDPKAGVLAELDLAYRFRWLVASRSTIIQSSSPHPGLSEFPEKLLDRMFDKYVLGVQQ